MTAPPLTSGSTVAVSTDDGQQITLNSGEQVSYGSVPASPDGPGWQSRRRLGRGELDARRTRSILLNGFSAPMETLPVIDRELGLSG